MEDFLKNVFTEYGGLVGFLALVNVYQALLIRKLSDRNDHLSDRLLEAIEHSSQVMTELIEKLKSNG